MSNLPTSRHKQDNQPQNEEAFVTVLTKLDKKPHKIRRTSEDEEELPNQRQNREREERIWKRTLEQVQFKENDEEKYNKYPIKPGYGFYKALATNTLPIRKLKVNIPETLIGVEQNTTMIYTNDEGRLVRNQEVANFNEFDQKIKENNQKFCATYLKDLDRLVSQFDYSQNNELPIVITKKAMNDMNLHVDVKSVKMYQENKMQSAEMKNQTVLQRYVIAKALKASIFRLAYHTSNSTQQKANYGFRITNKIDILRKDTKKQYQMNYNTLAFYESDKANIFDIQKIQGRALEVYEKQAKNIVYYLERGFGVRIEFAVFDFIQGLEGKVWVLGMKSLQLGSISELSRNLKTVQQDRKSNLDELTCSVYCKLCGLIFKSEEASKVLTYKLLWELLKHLKKRGQPVANLKMSDSSTRPARVCNLCYMLVVGEHELIEIEQQFARIQNIPIQDAVIRVPLDNRPKHRPALLSQQLNQWRLIVYINELTKIDKSMNINFNNLYFQYKLHNFRSCFKINMTWINDNEWQVNIQEVVQNITKQERKQKNTIIQRNISKSVGKQSSQLNIGFYNRFENEAQWQDGKKPYLFVNKIRVHYFFSEDNDITKFLNQSEIKVRLTRGTDWNNFIAEGSTKTLQQFKPKYVKNNDNKNGDSGQRHQSQVLLFFQDAQYCKCKIQLGLVFDDTYNTQHLNLYNYNGIYFPDEGFYNTNPFPKAWMEMFDINAVKIPDDMNQNANYDKYSPKCTQKELSNMIDYDAFKGRHTYKKYVESGVKKNWSSSLNLKRNNTNKEPFHQMVTNISIKMSKLKSSLLNMPNASINQFKQKIEENNNHGKLKMPRLELKDAYDIILQNDNNVNLDNQYTYGIGCDNEEQQDEYRSQRGSFLSNVRNLEENTNLSTKTNPNPNKKISANYLNNPDYRSLINRKLEKQPN